MSHACRDAGINFFDCANMYQKRVAEKHPGSFIEESRHELIITTKGYGAMGEDLSGAGNSRKHLVKSLNYSLKRLKNDYVYIYFIHHYDPHTGIKELLRTLDEFVRCETLWSE